MGLEDNIWENACLFANQTTEFMQQEFQPAVILIAGDLVHPRDGKNYWAGLKTTTEIRNRIAARDRLVHQKFLKIRDEWASNGFAAAETMAAGISKYQCVHVCRSKAGVEDCLKQLRILGFECPAFSDSDLETIGDFVISVFTEDYSYGAWDG